MSKQWNSSAAEGMAAAGANIKKWLLAGALFIVLWVVVGGSVVIVESGHVGVVTHFGAVQAGILPEGMHFVMPIRTKVVRISVRVQKIEAEASASSKDLQIVTSRVALNYYLSKEKANIVFQELGIDYQSNIIEPTIQESIKSITSRYTAEELITRRPQVKKDVYIDIKERLAENNIVVTDFSIVDFNFSAEFNRAIEAKQIAEQKALTAKNDLTRIQTEAEQAKARAEGEAQAMLTNAKAQAEAQILLGRSLDDRVLQLKAIERWDGVMPVSMGEGNGTFIDLGAITKKGGRK
jgi:regulator of protease activity HflC (stomatin/prohibitin superfamily)